MQITKKQSRWLRYMARANYKANYENRDTSDGKVKHREFPCYGLSYDETAVGNGLCELTNIVISGKPFEGSYDDLVAELSAILDGKEAVEAPHTLSGTLSRLLPEGSEVTERVEGDTLVVDVYTKPSVSVEAVDIKVDVSKSPVSVEAVAIPADASKPESPIMDEAEQPPCVTTGITDGVDFQAVAESAVDNPADNAEEPAIPEEPTPKPATIPELYALRIRCATHRLATLYGERPDMDIGEIFSRYPDATERLNTLYATDGIKPYTVSEDAIREAYPTEFDALKQEADDA